MPRNPGANEIRESCAEDVIEHVRGHFGPVQDLALAEIVPVSGIRVHVCVGRTMDEPKILFTTGMSNLPQNVPSGKENYRFTELLVRVPRDWPVDAAALEHQKHFWPIRWLKEIAWYPLQSDTWLGGDFTIISNGEPPEPLGPGTRLTCIMLMRETDDVNPVRCRDGRSALLYSIVPLYTEERDLERTRGVGALLERFSECGISFVLDPLRRNIAMPGC